MTDEELREEANAHLLKADRYDKNDLDKMTMEQYSKAILCLSSMEEKTDKDYRLLARIYKDMALIQFNKDQYLDAVANYYECTQCLHKAAINDEVRRLLIQRYIDLADALAESKDVPQAQKVMERAVGVFNTIADKTDEEKSLGNPAQHFKAFHVYFAKATSTQNYLRSTAFENHAQLFDDNQQADSLASSMADTDIDEINQLNRGLINNLAVSSASSVAPITLAHTNAESFRYTGQQYLSLAGNYAATGQKGPALVTLKQALDAYNAISEKNPDDHRQIDTIRQTKSQLEKTNCIVGNSPAQAASHSPVNPHHFFSALPYSVSQAPITAVAGLEENEEMDESTPINASFLQPVLATPVVLSQQPSQESAKSNPWALR